MGKNISNRRDKTGRKAQYWAHAVFRRPISANLRFNLYPGFFFFHVFFWKAFSRVIISILLKPSNRYVVALLDWI